MSFNYITKRIRLILYPFSILYGLVIRVRHKLFDWNIIKSKSFNIPVICVGNLTIGGTGKTPQIEYLIELLKDKYDIAVLSRGYKRKTKGFVLANKKSTPSIIGDEPFQISQKFPKSIVAVCEKRVEGINRLLENKNNLDIILLDDAFQHRYVKPGINILLIDYNRPIFSDRLLPVGNLRDSIKQMKRADIVIVTKTPKKITAIEKRIWINQLSLYPYQKLFFSNIIYSEPIAIFKKNKDKLNLSDFKNKSTKILLVSGIANPKPLEDYIKSNGLEVNALNFSDHHNFSQSDIDKIKTQYDSISGKEKIILTTEKDAVRFKYHKDFPKAIKNKIYYLPIRHSFLYEGKLDFDKTILDYVRTNKKYGQLYP